jgi:hypothetical protein
MYTNQDAIGHSFMCPLYVIKRCGPQEMREVLAVATWLTILTVSKLLISILISTLQSNHQSTHNVLCVYTSQQNHIDYYQYYVL